FDGIGKRGGTIAQQCASVSTNQGVGRAHGLLCFTVPRATWARPTRDSGAARDALSNQGQALTAGSSYCKHRTDFPSVHFRPAGGEMHPPHEKSLAAALRAEKTQIECRRRRER